MQRGETNIITKLETQKSAGAWSFNKNSLLKKNRGTRFQAAKGYFPLY